MEHDRQVFVLQEFIELVAQLVLGPHQMDPHGQFPAGKYGSANLRLRSFIGANRVEHNVGKHLK